MKYTVLGRGVVDVAVAEGTASGGVATDTNGSERLEFGEGLKKLGVGDVRVEVADVEGGRRRNRHGRAAIVAFFFGFSF